MQNSVNAPNGNSRNSVKVQKSLLPKFFELDDFLRATAGVPLLTAEGRVLLWVALNGPAPVSVALGVSGASYGTFYSVIRRLKEAQLIRSEQDKSDQRVRNISLNQALEAEILL